MSRRLKRMVLSTLTIGILTPQLIGCATTSQTEPFQKLEKENVIEAIQTVTEEEKESLVETTSEEIESENRMVEEDTSTSVEGDKVEQIEENTENLKETTGVQIVEEFNKKMYVISDSYAYDIDGVNGESMIFNAGFGLDVTGLTSNDWYRVQSGGYIGYMPKEYLSEDEYYSIGSQLAREEAERQAAEQARLEAERKAEEARLQAEREAQAAQQATESEEQRLAREEAERQAAEQARLEAEEKARQEAEQARLQAEAESKAAEQIAQNQETRDSNVPDSIPDWWESVNITDPNYGNYGHTGEVVDATDLSEKDGGGGMFYGTDMSNWAP